MSHYGILTGLFLSGYGVFRFIVEYFREPDPQLGYYFGGLLTMGQILCFIQLLFGLGLIFISKSKEGLKRKESMKRSCTYIALWIFELSTMLTLAFAFILN